MLLPSSSEPALAFSSNYMGRDLLYEWISDKRWQSSSSCIGSEVLTTSNLCTTPGKNNSCKRRKLQNNAVVVLPVDPDVCKPVYSAEKHPPVTADVISEDKLDSDFGDTRATSIDESTEDTKVIECVNSGMGLQVLDEGSSLRELCMHTLRSHQLLRDSPVTCGMPPEVVRFDNACTECCQICGGLENVLNLLICDYCEETFHKSCCDPKSKILPNDDWFCPSCVKLKRRSSSEIYFQKSRGSSWSIRSSPIENMLRCPEPYVSRVRIGKAFQAEVPEWSGQTSYCHVDYIDQPLDINLADSVTSSLCYDKNPKHHVITNWLQCQEALCDDSRTCAQGTICGKWRRAPLFEVQTDDWDCFCSILWDPTHSDCAVPQELETSEVLEQLKYIEKLKSRLAVKKMK